MQDKLCIIRNTFGDRSPFLQVSLENQEEAEFPFKINTFIFIDPDPQENISPDYDKDFFSEYEQIRFSDHKERMSWYFANKYIFDNYEYEYVLSIEDDVLISKDYIKICDEIIKNEILNNYENILFFHIGAWEEPKGNTNDIVFSGASSRSILISRNKFKLIEEFVQSQNPTGRVGNDALLSRIMSENKMKAIAPKCNRHGHFGVYGWSSSGLGADIQGQKSVFDRKYSHEELYQILKESCFDKEKLLKLNQFRNPRYFWNFNPNMHFEKLVYKF